ncbi:hypothetical protein BZL30_6371 [Mycobacterium kansasii]|uniref:Uncharacterized protein n=1 Tax=Mycobacterium kansasii TaxID=1768 RepID=A0A1V3WVK5_MYCKA|nr:hypothetical protein BZL30_6371 [Mycobacterium kansasii]
MSYRRCEDDGEGNDDECRHGNVKCWAPASLTRVRFAHPGNVIAEPMAMALIDFQSCRIFAQPKPS